MPDDILNFELTGMQDLEDKLKKLGQAAIPAAAGSLYRSAEKVMASSKQNYVPYDTGALMNSGHVEPPSQEGNNVLVVLGYGGPSAPYAIYVHEIDKHYHHNRQWKYLSTPLEAALPDIDTALSDDLDAAFQKL